MSRTADLDTGLAQLVADAGAGTYAPDDVIDAQTNPIVLGSLPYGISPCIGVITVPLASDPVRPTGTVIAQFRLRGTAAQNRDAADLIDDALNGLQDVQFGSVTLTEARGQSFTADAPNETGQLERTCQYRLELDLPETALRAH